MDDVGLRSSGATVTATHAIGLCEIEQVVEGESVVVADRNATLVSTGGVGAAVVCIDREP